MAAPALAQSPGDEQPAEFGALASKEEMIRERLERLQDRVFRLREQLAQTEPENAARLARVLERAGELGLTEQLDEITRLLRDSSSLADVVDVQARWMEDVDQLLDILLQRDSGDEQRQRDLGRLEAYREGVSQVLAQEQALRDASAQASILRRLANQLQQAVERVDRLLDRHERVTRDTKDQSSLPDSPLRESLAIEQLDIARTATELVEDLERLSRSEPDEHADSPEARAAREQAAAAGESLHDGAGAMAQASEDVNQGNQESASARQDEARQALQRARDRLEAARRRLEQLPSVQDQAGEQRDVARRTGELSEKMREEPSGEGRGPHPGGLQNPPSPGLENLDESRRRMGDAAEALDRDDPERATQSQEQALEHLEQTLRELDEALSQLRKEDRAETLSDLESRFREMLARQRMINAATEALDQLGDDNFTRAERLQAVDLSVKERALGERAQACVHILDEEGTTVVFPRVVGQLAEDMNAVADRLAALRVASLTQSMQQELVSTLEQLLESVKRMQQENEQEGDFDDRDGEDGPLLPMSAELKLLRSSQHRVNTRTAAIEEAIDGSNESNDRLRRALEETAARQAQCTEMAREMRDRRNRP